jgi:hypothetical protein
MRRKNPPYTIDELQNEISKLSQSGKKMHKVKPADEVALIAKGTIIANVDDDEELGRLIHNLIEMDGGTRMKNVVSVCQKQFQERYPNMKAKEWMHLVNAYIKRVTGKQNVKENDIISV